MYRYDEFDQRIVDQRVVQYRDQTRRFLAGELTEDEFRPLRLQNGLYIQKHAPMLRVAIPYGLLSTTQLLTLAHIARKYDRGYGHFTTRQNLQFNWPRLEDTPDILAELAQVQMHAIQTSGNCVRNITSDPLAGVSGDEIIDPRPWSELVRQWSTVNPEFAFLPRKFKIAISGAIVDRTAALVHDIGAQAVRNEAGKTGFRTLVGGGQGRTPMIGYAIREFLPAAELLNYFDAILRVYNRHGRRDNIYKARIKILVKELTQSEFTRQVEAEWEHLRTDRERFRASGNRPPRLAFRGSTVSRICARQCRIPCGDRRQPPVRALGRAQRARPQTPRLCDRHAIVETHRHAARGRERKRDGRHRHVGRPLQLRRSSRDARAESLVRRRAAVGRSRIVMKLKSLGSQRRTSDF
jgi:sulfite reductase beta subunit-like hemoprotein